MRLQLLLRAPPCAHPQAPLPLLLLLVVLHLRLHLHLCLLLGLTQLTWQAMWAAGSLWPQLARASPQRCLTAPATKAASAQAADLSSSCLVAALMAWMAYTLPRCDA